jgi:hypothetical protein
LRRDEFLVIAVMSRSTKNQDSMTGLGQSFIFKIVTGETVEATKERLGAYQCANERLLSFLVFQVGSRRLNGNEKLDNFLRPNDTLKIVLPSGLRCKSLLRAEKSI